MLKRVTVSNEIIFEGVLRIAMKNHVGTIVVDSNNLCFEAILSPKKEAEIKKLADGCVIEEISSTEIRPGDNPPKTQ